MICAPTGTQWHSAASLGFENNAGKQRALWIYGKSLPCMLRRLQIPFCEDTTEVLAGGTQVWNAEGKQHEGVKRHYRHWRLNLRSGETIPGSPMQTSPSLELREGENAGSMGENVILKFISLWHCLSAVCALSRPLHRSIAHTRLTASLCYYELLEVGWTLPLLHCTHTQALRELPCLQLQDNTSDKPEHPVRKRNRMEFPPVALFFSLRTQIKIQYKGKQERLVSVIGARHWDG